jgi:hypothetical protein
MQLFHNYRSIFQFFKEKIRIYESLHKKEIISKRYEGYLTGICFIDMATNNISNISSLIWIKDVILNSNNHEDYYGS